MKLFLFSQNFGKEPKRILDLINKNTCKALVVANAADNHSPEQRKKRLFTEFNTLKDLGIDSEELDLREYDCSQKDELLELLSGVDLIWVRGGNVFYLLWLMKESGFDKVISPLIKDNKIVYGGYSAGALVLTPTIKGLECMDDLSVVPKVVWKGLDLIDYSIIPHWDRADCKDKTMAIQARLENSGLPFRVLRDGEVIIVDGDKEYKI